MDKTRYRVCRAPVRALLCALAALALVGQALFVGARGVESASEVELIAIADATLAGGQPSANWGSEPWTYIGNDPYERQGMRRTLVRFDLSSIPPRTAIDSALLVMHCSQSSWDGPMDVTVYRVTEDWLETTVTWDSHATRYAESWATLSVPDARAGPREHAWRVTALVQAWLDGTYPNYGMLLKSGEYPPYDPAYRRLDARENADPLVRPRLVVRWGAPPAPTPSPRALWLPLVLANKQDSQP